MPYITKGDRDFLERYPPNSKEPGHLNYAITKLIKEFLDDRRRIRISTIDAPKTPNNYEDYNTVIGVLECAKLELYRRMVSPYEDKKIEENGDVF